MDDTTNYEAEARALLDGDDPVKAVANLLRDCALLESEMMRAHQMHGEAYWSHPTVIRQVKRINIRLALRRRVEAGQDYSAAVIDTATEFGVSGKTVRNALPRHKLIPFS